MHSLTELRDYLVSQGIKCKSSGWQLHVGKDTWTMAFDKFYCNNQLQPVKDKKIFDKYKEIEDDSKDTQTRKWRGIGSRNHRD